MRAYNLIINIINRFILFDFNYQLVAGNFWQKKVSLRNSYFIFL